MPHIFAGAQFIAPIYYFGVDDPTEEDIARDEAPFRVCLLDEGNILPTWSSLDRYQDFFRIYRGGSDHQGTGGRQTEEDDVQHSTPERRFPG